MASLSNVYGGRLDEIRLEAEENGWDLVVESELGTYRFCVHGLASSGELEAQALLCLRQLADWQDEGRRAAREHEIDLAKQATDESYDRMVGDA